MAGIHSPSRDFMGTTGTGRNSASTTSASFTALTSSTPMSITNTALVPTSGSTSLNTHSTKRPRKSSRSRSASHPITPSQSPSVSAGKPLHTTIVSSNGNNAGIEAGIGVGCAVVGALIGALLIFFLMNRRQKRLRKSIVGAIANPGQSNDRALNNDKAGAAVITTQPMGYRNSPSALDSLLPQPVDTGYLSTELSKLQSLVRNHAGNFYHAQPVPPETLGSRINAEALSDIARGSPFPPSTWVELLANTTTRSTAIRFILSWTILKRIEPTCDISRTLLPLGMIGGLQSMGVSSATPQESEYLQSKWRVITSYLQQDRYQKNAFKEPDDRLENLENTILILDAVLQPLATPGDEAMRIENLRQILQLATSFGLTLASQPGKFDFDWRAVQGGRQVDSLVIFPALFQSGDDSGQGITAPMIIGDKVFAQNVALR